MDAVTITPEHQGPRGALTKIEAILDEAHLAAGDTGTITLGGLSDSMGERAFGLLLLILSLPCCLPFIYLLPQIVSLPMLVLTGQMARGSKAPWLPETLRKRQMPLASLKDVLLKAQKYGGWLERLAHPRFPAVTSERGLRIVGALLMVPTASILVPLPLTNTVPGFGVAVTSAGLIERDGFFVIMGLLIGLAWVVLLVIGGPTLLYFLIDWIRASTA